jgi:hypothetical protein
VGIISALVSLAVVRGSQASTPQVPSFTNITSPQMPSPTQPNFGPGTSVLPAGPSGPNGSGTRFVPGINPNAISTNINDYKNAAPVPPSQSNGVVGPSQADVTPQALEAGKIFAQAAEYEIKGDYRSAISLYEKADKIAQGSKISEEAGTKAQNLRMQTGL